MSSSAKPAHREPGVNTDALDVHAGLKCASKLGYGDPEAQVVAALALNLHRVGEEENAKKTWLGQYPHDLTSWFVILAHAIAAERSKSG